MADHPPKTVISKALIQRVAATIAHHFSPQKIILFGSHAQGEASPESDLDLLVIMETELPFHKRAVPIRLLFQSAPCPLDILVHTPEETAYWNGVTNHIITRAMATGKVLHAESGNQVAGPESFT
ncbi:MAG: nucleotidyltransferase domain-containing protein [Magnetococcales bacterium]|nr:nucleotidyltransferase domain-containing protein [Magnetococcales bacterium]